MTPPKKTKKTKTKQQKTKTNKNIFGIQRFSFFLIGYPICVYKSTNEFTMCELLG